MNLKSKITFLFLLTALLSACSAKKFLTKDEYILTKNTLVKAPINQNSNLKDLYKQKSNRKFLGLLLNVNLYNMGKSLQDTVFLKNEIDRLTKKFDAKIDSTEWEDKANRLEKRKENRLKPLKKNLKEGNIIMRSFGEAPVIFDSTKTNQTVEIFSQYLFSKGYFNNKISWKVKYRKSRRANVEYTFIPNKQYVVTELVYTAEDKTIDSIIQEEKKNSKIYLDEPYDEENLNTERDRIYKSLSDKGYFLFKKQNIFFDLDTTNEKNKIKVICRLTGQFEIYTLSKMYFNFETGNSEEVQKRDTFEYENVIYTYFKKKHLRKLIDYKIMNRPFEIYNKSKMQTTQRLLGSLDIFKYVNISITENYDDTLKKSLTAFINTSNLYKFQLSQEYGLSIGQASYPGPFLSLTLKSRNIFNALEVMENSIRYTFEAQTNLSNNKELFNTHEINASTNILLSQLLIPSFLRKKLMIYNPKVKLYTGYTYAYRQEYVRQSFRASLSYTYELNKNSFLTYSPIDILFINSTTSPAFTSFLDDLKGKGSNLFLSFKPSIVTNFNINYTYNNFDFNAKKTTKFIKPYFEIGGIIPHLATQAFGTNFEKENNLFANNQYFEYLKLGIDLRYYFPAGRKATFVTRINFGISNPIDASVKKGFNALPYEKYFFVGGNSSLRAWKPRRLGPGSYADNRIAGYPFEQPGEILFEMNYEYRFKMFSFFDGALFIDAGNVWMIKDETRPGSSFKGFDSFSEIAVGAGVGLRLNFSFLIIRFDLANQIWDPSKHISERLINSFKFEDTVLNIGIGYPF